MEDTRKEQDRTEQGRVEQGRADTCRVSLIRSASLSEKHGGRPSLGAVVAGLSLLTSQGLPETDPHGVAEHGAQLLPPPLHPLVLLPPPQHVSQHVVQSGE